jgi:LEA14-like dessication related protein
MQLNWKRIGIGAAILGVVGFTSWYLLRQFKMLSDYCYKFWKGKVTHLGIKRVDFSLWFVITNKSDIDIEITSQYYKIYVNNSMISNVGSSDYIHLPAKGSGTFKIDATFNPLQIIQVSLQNISDLIANRENIKIDIEGYANAGSGGIMVKRIPIKYSTNLEELTEDETDIPASEVTC